MLCLDAKPNTAHKALARLEQMGKLTAVVTQNIDGLHQAAGSQKVLELHGSVLRNYCEKCRKSYPVEEIVNSTGVPTCSCGGRIKPDVVLYEEGLDQYTLQEAVRVISDADMLIIGGTSLAVYPAAGLIDYYLSLLHISEPTRLPSISYAVFCLKKKKNVSHSLSYLCLLS